MASFRLQGIDHVELYVRDLNAALRWYGDVLGLAVLHGWDPEPVMIGAGESKLALFLAKPSSPATADLPSREGVGWHRLAWRTSRAGFEAAQRHFTNRGIGFRGPVDHNIARSIYLNDPDGNLLEITYYV